MRKFLIGVALAGGLALASGAYAAPCHKPVKANHTKHTIKAANPAKRLGGGLKGIFVGLGRTLDAAIVDPIGIGLQGFADFVDMMVAAPLEAQPEPFETLGDGVHVIYVGLDKLGQQLAK